MKYIVSDKFLKIELILLLGLISFCLITVSFLEDFLFSFIYYEKFAIIIFWLYFPLLVIFSTIIFFQIIMAYMILDDLNLKSKIFFLELLFFIALLTEIALSTKIRL